MVPFAAIGFVLYPIFSYYVNGEVVPFFLYELPFFDENSITGYIILMLFQGNLLALGVVGAVLAICIFFIFSMYALAISGIFIVHMRELNNMLYDQVSVGIKTDEISLKWKQCMHDHELSTRLINCLDDMFGLMCLVQVMMGIFSICDVMLLVALTDWYPTYFFLLTLFSELSINFIIGHIVELKIDEMYETITSTAWYRLPVVNQKEFRFMLSRQQRPMVLTAYGFYPMNFEAYMSVLRGLYQFFVMIMQYVG
ncbi:odorant receptor 67d-like [Anopheles nili]|uniref:odorant receptor 67d-like n=1 Tax=Anopheles nili TaxID=185578 RepID=UPI00237B6A98|nr:odorant receptor 67d-like [Anopheles nili]